MIMLWGNLFHLASISRRFISDGCKWEKNKQTKCSGSVLVYDDEGVKLFKFSQKKKISLIDFIREHALRTAKTVKRVDWSFATLITYQISADVDILKWWNPQVSWCSSQVLIT